MDQNRERRDGWSEDHLGGHDRNSVICVEEVSWSVMQKALLKTCGSRFTDRAEAEEVTAWVPNEASNIHRHRKQSSASLGDCELEDTLAATAISLQDEND